MRQLDPEIVRHARRAGGEHDDARAEEHRLGDAVGDEHDGLLRLAARCAAAPGSSSRASAHRARRTARPSGSASDRGSARARSRRAAACRRKARRDICLPRPSARPARADRAPARGFRAIGRPRISAGSSTLSITRRHFSSSGCWNTMPMSRDGSNGCAGEPMRTSPASCGVQAGENFQQRGLAAAGRADQRDQLAGLDVERRLARPREIRRRACGRPS